MDYDNKITGKVIRQLRLKKGLTQDVLSGLAGIGRSHLTMIEQGDKNANVEKLWRISNALDLPLSNLISMVEREMTNPSGCEKERGSGRTRYKV